MKKNLLLGLFLWLGFIGLVLCPFNSKAQVKQESTVIRLGNVGGKALFRYDEPWSNVSCYVVVSYVNDLSGAPEVPAISCVKIK